jgi:hypothetical protein
MFVKAKAIGFLPCPPKEENAPPWPACENLFARPCSPPALAKEATKNPHERIRSARRIGLSGHRTEYRVE